MRTRACRCAVGIGTGYLPEHKSAIPAFWMTSLSSEGPRSRHYRRTAALRLHVQPCDEGDDDGYSFILFLVMEHRWNEIDRGKPKYSGQKPVPVPLCPHGLTRDRTRASAVGGRRLTAWAMARPITSLTAE
jgi:hypothetical protein